MYPCTYFFSTSELLAESQNLLSLRKTVAYRQKVLLGPSMTSEHEDGHAADLSLVLGVLHALAPTVMELDLFLEKIVCRRLRKSRNDAMGSKIALIVSLLVR